MIDSGNYILDEQGNPVKEPDRRRWAEWYEKNDQNRLVALDEVGNAEVSTVFLGIDYSHGRGAPLLYETMIIGGNHDYQRRYSNREEAKVGHNEAVELARKWNNANLT